MSLLYVWREDLKINNDVILLLLLLLYYYIIIIILLFLSFNAKCSLSLIRRYGTGTVGVCLTLGLPSPT